MGRSGGGCDTRARAARARARGEQLTSKPGRRTAMSSSSVAAEVEAAVVAARSSAALAALRLREQSHCWAALSTGTSREILDAVHLLHPSSLDKVRSFVAAARDGRVAAATVPKRMHALLDAETTAITTDPQQFGRVRDALEKLATTRIRKWSDLWTQL